MSIAGVASVLCNTLTPDFVVQIAGPYFGTPIRSRQMEPEADHYAVAAMLQADLDPAAGADLMRHFSEGEDDDYEFFSSHPTYAERIDMFMSASRTGGAILTLQQWRALENICSITTKTAPVSPPEPS